HLHKFNFKSPWIGYLIHDLSQSFVDFIPISKHFIEKMLPDHVAERGQGGLVRGIGIIFYRYDRFGRVLDLVIQNGIHLNRYAVPRDGFLRLNVHRCRANIYPHLAVDKRDDPVQSWPLHMFVSPQTKYDSALVLSVHPKSQNDEKNYDDTQPD